MGENVISLSTRQCLDIILVPDVSQLPIMFQGPEIFEAAARLFSIRSAEYVGLPKRQQVFDSYRDICLELLRREESFPKYRKPSAVLLHSCINVVDGKTGEHFLAVDGGPENGGYFFGQTRDCIISPTSPRELWPSID